MGADSFHVCFGIRREVNAAESAAIELLEKRRHPWQLAARQHKLQCWWGGTIDEEQFFALIGRLTGHFGWEGESAAQLSTAEASVIASETTARLRAAGFDETPAWHFQFVPDR